MRKLAVKITTLMLLTLSAVGCQLLHHDEEVARVGESVLMRSELDAITNEAAAADSALVAECYVNQWVMRQVKLQEAERVLASEIAGIEQMVEEYRGSLLVGRLEQRYLAGKIDTLITDAMVREHFEAHRNDFLMDRTILKGRIVRLPDNYRQSVKLFNLMGSKSEEKQQDFLDLCEKNNLDLYTFDSWVDFSEFLSYLPVRRDKNYDYVLEGKEIRQMADADSKYFIQIDAVIRKGEQAPLERVEDLVRKILFNRRRGEIVTFYNDSLMEAAKLQGAIRIGEEVVESVVAE